MRITDALNRTITAFSDGITVLVRQPNTALVRDGQTDVDIDYQEEKDALYANWNKFGNEQSPLPSDHIVR